MKRYLKARYYIPLTGFFLVILYVLFSLTGVRTAVKQRKNTFNRSGSGFFYFYRLFQQLDYGLKRWYEVKPPAEKGCLVYFDYFKKDNPNLLGILDWVREGNVLILAGIHTPTDPIFSGRIRFGPTGNVTVSPGLTSQRLTFSFSRSRCLETADGDTPLVWGESGALLTRKPLGKGTVYLFPDNNLFVNWNFRNPDHAVFLNALFKTYYNTTIYIYEYGTGVYKVRNPVMILFKGSLLFVTLHLVIMGLLFALRVGKRFGNPVHAEPFKRRSLSVHLAAVGGFYRKARAYNVTESFIRKYLVYRIKTIFNIKKNPTSRELAEILERHTGAPPAKIEELLGAPASISEKLLLSKRKAIDDLIVELRGYKKNKQRKK